MARNIRSPQLDSRTARLRLAKRRRPYWVALGRGLSLGYRRNATDSPWIVRKSDGHGGNWIRNFAVADDHAEADGERVLTFYEAQAKARDIARGGASAGALITVNEALTRYAADLKARNALATNVSRVRKHLPASVLGKPVNLLTAHELREWRDGLIDKMARSTVNRTVTPLRAALELTAAHDPRIDNQVAWQRGLAKLPGATKARNVVLTEDVVRTIVRLAYEESLEFGRMVETAAVTGARLSQLGRLAVADVHIEGSTAWLMMPTSRKGQGEKVVQHYSLPIPVSLAAKLWSAAGGRPADQPLLLQADGKPWKSTDIRYWQTFRNVVERAGLDPALVTMYALRHTDITRQLIANLPIRIVAAMHDTSVVQIEKTYAKYITSHSDAVYRRALLDLGPQAQDEKVVALKR